MVKTRIDIEGRNRSQQAFQAVDRQFGGLLSRINSVTGAGRGLAGVLSAGLFVRAGREALDFADRVEKVNRRLGISTEFLSQTRFAAEQSGVEFENIGKAVEFMQDNLVEAERGTKAQAEAFAALGINIARFARLRPEDQFEAIIQQLAALDSQSQRINIARDIFGRGGVDVLQLATEGAEGFRALREEADQLGLTLTESAAKGAAAANDSFNRTQRSLSAITQTIAVAAAPALEGLSNFLGGAVPLSANAAGIAWNTMIGVIRGAIAALLDLLGRGGSAIASFLDFANLPGAGSLRSAVGELELLEASFVKLGNAALVDGAAGVEQFKFKLGEIIGVANDASAAVESVTASVPDPTFGGSVDPVPPGIDEEFLRQQFPGIDEILRGVLSEQGQRDALQSDLAFTIESAIRSGAESGASGLVSTLLDSVRNNLISNLADLIAGGISGGAGGGGGGGGFFGFLGGLFGAQTGGTFSFGSGADSSLLALRVSPSERGEIAVRTTTQQAQVELSRGRGSDSGITFVNDFRGADRSIIPLIDQKIAASERRSIARMQDLRRRT